MNYIELKQIDELIKSGFDIELISFELNIPLQELRNYLKNYEDMNTHNKRDNKKMLAKISRMKRKYKNLFYTDYSEKAEEAKVLSEDENKIIYTTINDIENKLNTMKFLSKTDKKDVANSILLDLKKIDNFTLDISQSEKLYVLLHTANLSNLNIKRSDKTDFNIRKKQKNITKKLAHSIDIEQSKVEKIDELKLLESKLTRAMMQEEPILVGSVKSKIQNKIFKLNHQNYTYQIRNDVSNNVNSIVLSLADGTLNLENSEQLIESEITERQEKLSTNKLSKEQIKNQIFIQIKTLLKEQTNKYCIQYPEKALEQLQQLTNVDTSQGLSIIVTNLITEKSFEKAKTLCNNFLINESDENLKSTILTLKKNIRNSEIGDMVLKGLSMNESDDKQIAYFKLIEKGIIKGNVKLSSVPLGKSKDGLRNIYLSDIMEAHQLER